MTLFSKKTTKCSVDNFAYFATALILTILFTQCSPTPTNDNRNQGYIASGELGITPGKSYYSYSIGQTKAEIITERGQPENKRSFNEMTETWPEDIKANFPLFDSVYSYDPGMLGLDKVYFKNNEVCMLGIVGHTLTGANNGRCFTIDGRDYFKNHLDEILQKYYKGIQFIDLGQEHKRYVNKTIGISLLIYQDTLLFIDIYSPERIK